MRRVLGIFRDELAAGFTLAGVEVSRVRDSAGAREVLQGVTDGTEYGLVIIEESLLEGLEERERERLDALNIPLVVPVPGELRWRTEAEPPADDAVARLIRRAVGYQLDIRL